MHSLTSEAARRLSLPVISGVWRWLGGEEGEQRLAGQRCAAKGGERAHHAEVLPGWGSGSGSDSGQG